MAEDITSELLFKRLKDEKLTGEMLPLDENFYKKTYNMIQNLEKTPSTMKEAENIKKMLTSLLERRRQKLLLYLAYDKPLPKPIPMEEENLYAKVQEILNNESEQIKIAKIKIISEVPEIITPYGKKLGPYKSNEVLEIYDDQDARFLLSNKIGEEV
jgi:DNA replication initiation complex subunit (GINS family)